MAQLTVFPNCGQCQGSEEHMNSIGGREEALIGKGAGKGCEQVRDAFFNEVTPPVP